MSLPIILSLFSALPLFWIGWRSTRNIAHGLVRNAVRVLIAATIVLAAGPWLLRAWAEPLDRGRWRCTICGRDVEESRYFGLPFETRDERDLSIETRAAKEFERWFWAAVGEEHEHDWMSVGCHSVGLGTVACSMYRARSYYLALPKLHDQALARAMVKRIMSWDPATRREQFRSFEHAERPHVDSLRRDPLAIREHLEEREPWRSISEGSPLSDSEFARLYAAWLELHPAWK